jgi:hypothetical protein
VSQFATGRTQWSSGAPLATHGPVFLQATQAIRAPIPNRIPAGLIFGSLAAPGFHSDTSFGTGRIFWNYSTVITPTTGPVFRQATRVIRAPIPNRSPLAGLVFGGLDWFVPNKPGDSSMGSGRVMWDFGAPPPAVGPVFYPARRAIQAQLPRRPSWPRAGRVVSNAGGPVRNPVPAQGPPLRPLTTPIRAKIPLLPRTGGGRVASSPGVQMGAGPAVYPLQSAVRARLPQLQPFAGLIFGSLTGLMGDTSFGTGRVMWSSGEVTATIGPVFTGKSGKHAIQARLPRLGFYAGLVYGSLTTPSGDTSFGSGRVLWSSGSPAVTTGPVFRQVIRAVRASPPLPPRGRIASNAGGPVRNPVITSGPAFFQATSPARIRLTLPLRGRTGSNAGGPVRNPAPIPGPVFFPVRFAVRIRPALPPRGRVSFNSGGPLHNPSAGPVFRQAVRPARAIIPQVFSKGRVGSNLGIPAPSPGPAFKQVTSPARSHPAAVPRGRIASNAGIPVPFIGPPFRQVTSSVNARFDQPYRGRVGSNPGGLVAPTPGPPFVPQSSVDHLRRIRPALPSRGRVTFSIRTPVQNPSAGAVFYSAVRPAASRVPLPLRGRVYSNPGGPVKNPVPGIIGPPFYPFRSPVRIRITLPPRGRISSNRGIVRNPLPGPQVYPLTGPVRSRPVALAPRAGRILTTSLPTLLPVFVTPWHHPIRPWIILPPRGRVAGTKAVLLPPPPQPPPVYPLQGPVHARVPLPPRGRVASNAGAPLRNPAAGPVLIQLRRPVQARQPLPLHGRVGSNQGGPVKNPPAIVIGVTFIVGKPQLRWTAGPPHREWVT